MAIEAPLRDQRIRVVSPEDYVVFRRPVVAALPAILAPAGRMVAS